MAKIFVGGLPKLCDESVLSAYFSNFGEVMSAELKRDTNTNQSRGFAFVTFTSPQGSRAALACYDQHCIGGKWVEVKLADESLNKTNGPGGNPGAGHKGAGKGGKPMQQYGAAAWDPWQGGNAWASPQIKGKGKGGMQGKAGGGKGKGGKDGKSKMHDNDPNKLFVGGLPKEATEEDLKAYFCNFGTIKEIEIKTDSNTNLSRGFGFVTFVDDEAARSCCEMYDSHELQGKWIEVKSATINGQPAPGQKGGDKGQNVEEKKMFVGGLPQDVGEEAVMKWAGQFGIVESVDLKKDESGKPRGFGFINFGNSDAALQCLNNYADNQISGKWVEVKQAAKQVPGQGKGKGKGSKGMGKGGPSAYSHAMQMQQQAGYGMSMQSAYGKPQRYSPY